MKPSSCFLLAGILVLSGLHAANPQGGPANADPFVREQVQQVNQPRAEPKVLSVCFETFSLDLAEAAGLYRKMVSDGKLYEEILARVAKGQAKQESFAVIRARSGEKAVVESISEFIYPTEYDHGNGPTPAQPSAGAPTDGAQPAPTPAPAPAAPAGNFAPVLPTSFETRNTGFTFEIEPTLGGDDFIVDLRMSPEFVTLADKAKWGQGVSETELPIFESQRVNTSSTLKLGLPHMVSTLSRPPVSKVDTDSAERIWFAFVTVDLVNH